MKLFRQIIFLSCSAMLLSLSLPAQDMMEKANRAYMERDYAQALKAYESLLHGSTIPSADLLYNIGNCYYKMGQLGKSVLYYERAARLNPDDEDIAFNLKLAGLKAVDRIEPVPPIIYKRWFQSVAGAFTVPQWSVILVIFIWLSFAGWAYYLFSRSVTAKKTGFVLAMVLSACCLLIFLLLNDTYRETSVRQYAVVVASSSYVKSAPDERGNDQFILHEGTRMEVLDELGDWKKIRIANGSVGWLKGKDIEVI